MERSANVLSRMALLSRDVVFRTDAAVGEIRGLAWGWAFAALALPWVCVLMDTLLAMTLGRKPFVAPYVTFGPRDYYFYQAFYRVPYAALLWLLVSIVAFGISRLVGGTGTLRATSVYVAFVSLALLPLWWPLDLAGILFGFYTGPVIIPVHAAVALFEGWLYAKGLQRLHGVPLRWALVAGYAAMVAYRPAAVLLIR